MTLPFYFLYSSHMRRRARIESALPPRPAPQRRRRPGSEQREPVALPAWINATGRPTGFPQEIHNMTTRSKTRKKSSKINGLPIPKGYISTSTPPSASCRINDLARPSDSQTDAHEPPPPQIFKSSFDFLAERRGWYSVDMSLVLRDVFEDRDSEPEPTFAGMLSLLCSIDQKAALEHHRFRWES